MSKRPIWTQKALQQLDALDDYLLENAPQYADRIINEIIRTPAELPLFPLKGQVEETLQPAGRYRYLVYSHYKIIYTVRNSDIYIMSLFDTRQDPSKMVGSVGEI